VAYLPPAFAELRPEVLFAHIERYAFGLLVSHGAGGLGVSHLPFLPERRRDALVLLAHLARDNPQLADLADGGEVLAIFAGPHAYVSPGWYASAPSVPTWNYADVYAYGRARLIDDRERLKSLLHRLTERYEAANPTPWRIGDLPGAFLDSMLDRIVGFEIAVARLEGKYKLSQNRPAADRPLVIAALERSGDADGAAVARLMRERQPG
jgi:transcriptional regulator